VKRTKRNTLIVLAGIVAALALAAVLWLRGEPMDIRYNGAYRLDDGRLVVVTPREGRELRYRMMDGESAALRPVGEASYEAGPGWETRRPVLVHLTFQDGPRGDSKGFTWRRDGRQQRARRMPLSETIFTFRSDGLTLRGKLVAPAGGGPFPAVVIVQGSEEDSAVDSSFEPYLFAANGIPTLVYDKRGTGRSEGRYTQNFDVLAGDAVAAVNWLRTRPEIEPKSVSLAGFSQGGWIAPLAALRDGKIRSLLIGFGPTVPVMAQDRWGYAYALREKGFGDEAIARADAVSGLIGAMIDRGEDRWGELGRALDAAKKEPWFQAAKGSNSALGFITSSRLPLWAIRLYARWKLEPTGGKPFIDRLYDPAPTLASLRSTPSLWIFGGEDHSTPTAWSIAVLERLQVLGRPIQIKVFPQADHGILRFEAGRDGERHYLGYEPAYFDTEVEWLRRQSGLPARAAADPD
jgi:dienelactone hydrolase